jgi:mannosyltransferase OCH1-like enzyme
MIPNQIYKIWIGENPIPDQFNRFLSTWDKSGCEIIEIGNKDVLDCIAATESRLMIHAMNVKNYTLLNHYLRYWILYNRGGLYADLDVEFIKPIDFDDTGLIIGMESERWINNCFMATTPKHQFFADCMDYMDNMDFDTMEIELETGPRLVTNLIQKWTSWRPKFMKDIESYVYVNQLVAVYPERYFSPFRWYQKYDTSCVKSDTCTVHHYCHSWKK